MKNIFIFLLLTSLLIGDTLIQRLDRLVQNKTTKQVVFLKYDPFFTAKEIQKTYLKDKQIKTNQKKTKKKKLNRLKLISILGNKAFVGNRWVGKNDIIHGYKVKNVLDNRLILVKKDKTMILGFEKSREILKVRER